MGFYKPEVTGFAGSLFQVSQARLRAVSMLQCVLVVLGNGSSSHQIFLPGIQFHVALGLGLVSLLITQGVIFSV